ncbi:hypothetical protein [Stetteria hydrogenophila]
MSRLRHPLFDWSECMGRGPGLERVLHLLGSTLLLEEVEVDGVPPFTLTHPRGVAKLRVNGGGELEAWEPLKPPVAECIGRPLYEPVWVGRPRFNPTNAWVDLLAPLGDGSFLHARAGPLGGFTYESVDAPLTASVGRVGLGGVKVPLAGRCSPREFGGWHACEGLAFSSRHAKIVTATPLDVETQCFRLRKEILHPAGFARLDYSVDEVEANAVHVSCPRASFYIASPFGFKASFKGHGRLRVEPLGLTVIGLGSRLDAVKALASTTPPRVEGAWVTLRGGLLCLITDSTGDRVRASAWNPAADDAYCEIVYRARARKARVTDPAGAVDVEVSRGILRLPVPGYTWVWVETERYRGLAEKLRELKELKH